MGISLNPYLSFRDTARSAMEFYQSIFGGEVTSTTFGEFQASEDPAEQDKIMHSVLTTEGGLVLMAADTPNAMDWTAGTNYSVSLSGDDAGRAARLLGPARRRRHDRRAAGAGAVGRQLRHAHRQVRRQLAGEHRRHPRHELTRVSGAARAPARASGPGP